MGWTTDLVGKRVAFPQPHKQDERLKPELWGLVGVVRGVKTQAGTDGIARVMVEVGSTLHEVPADTFALYDGQAIRDTAEINAAHDSLAMFVSGLVPLFDVVNPEATKKIMDAQLDVLCWVLQRKDGEGFGEAVKGLHGWLRSQGLVSTREDK